jgi:soluble lytic murein transglycosylase-like protein
VKKVDRYDSLIQFYAELNNLDWKLLKAQIRAESNFDPRAVSPVGAQGLCQFMPATWGEFGRNDPFNPEESIAAQARYMAMLIRFLPSENHALAGYNWGMGRVKRLIGIHGQDFTAIAEMMPQETQEYVKKILTFKSEYAGT